MYKIESTEIDFVEYTDTLDKALDIADLLSVAYNVQFSIKVEGMDYEHLEEGVH